ncbi:hypothetical protein K402DRAFT_463406 [Aulographum hederae CBS 113979]|uniref:Cytochrome b561 domain-containing protein n=1 Tax=Aulographum hederae CBS 113979 TaxID=1176131 RepID=A0A6G1H1K6_9PEZI|nr:hypothetical protein K402DRAFT_463406 [Aulographum hederae CBS 113979]
MAVVKGIETTGPNPHGTESLRTDAKIAHGVLMCLPFVLLYPFGGLIIRKFTSSRGWIIHAVWQVFGMVIMFVGFGLGCWLSWLQDEVSDRDPVWIGAHQSLGTVIVALTLVQPLIGLFYRRHDKKVSSWASSNWGLRTTTSFSAGLGPLHTNLGRLIIIVGIINGGIGFLWSNNASANQLAAYITVVVVATIAYFGFLFRFYSDRAREIDRAMAERMGDQGEIKKKTSEEEAYGMAMGTGAIGASSDEIYSGGFGKGLMYISEHGSGSQRPALPPHNQPRQTGNESLGSTNPPEDQSKRPGDGNGSPGPTIQPQVQSRRGGNFRHVVGNGHGYGRGSEEMLRNMNPFTDEYNAKEGTAQCS